MTYTVASSMAPDTTDPNPEWDMVPDTGARTTPASSLASLLHPTPAPARPARPASAIPPPRAKALTTPPRTTHGLVHSQLVSCPAPATPTGMGMAATWAPLARRDSAAPRGMISRSHSLASDLSEPDSAVGESNPPSGRGSRTASAEPEDADSTAVHDVAPAGFAAREEMVHDSDSDESLDETSIYPTTHQYARRAAYMQRGPPPPPGHTLTVPSQAGTSEAARTWPALAASSSDLSSSYVLSTTTTASSLENSTIAHLRRFGTPEQRAALRGQYSWAAERDVPDTPANSLSVASSDAVQSPVITPTVLDLDVGAGGSARMAMGMSVPTTEEGEMEDAPAPMADATSVETHTASTAHAAHGGGGGGESATITPLTGTAVAGNNSGNEPGLPLAPKTANPVAALPPPAPTLLTPTYVDAVEAWRLHTATTGLDHPSPPRSIATALSLSDGASTLASTWRSDPTPANVSAAARPPHRCPSATSEPRPPQSAAAAAARWVEEDEDEEEEEEEEEDEEEEDVGSSRTSSSKGRRRESVDEPMSAVRRRFRGATAGLPTPTSASGSASRRSKGSSAAARRTAAAAARTVERDEFEDEDDAVTRISTRRDRARGRGRGRIRTWVVRLVALVTVVSTAIAALFAWHLTGLVHDCSEQFGTLHWAWTSVRIPIAHGGTLSVPVLHCASYLANVMPVLDLAADMTHTLLSRPAPLRTLTANPLAVHHYQLDQLAWAVAERASRLPYARTNADIDASDGKRLGQQLTLASETVRAADRAVAALNTHADGALRVLVDVLTALDDAVRANEHMSLPEQVKEVVLAWTDASEETRELLAVEDGKEVALSERATRVVSRARSAWTALRQEVTSLRGLTRDAAIALEAAMARVDAATAAIRERVWKVDEARSRAKYEQQVREEAVVKAATLQAAAQREKEEGRGPATPPTASAPRAPPEPPRRQVSWWRRLLALLLGSTPSSAADAAPRAADLTSPSPPPPPPSPPAPQPTDVAAAAKAAAAAMAQHRAQDAMLALLKNAHENVQNAAQDVRGLLAALDAFDAQLLAVRELVTNEGAVGDRGVTRAAEHWVDVDRARVAAKIGVVRGVLDREGVQPIMGKKKGVVKGIEAPRRVGRGTEERGWRKDDEDEDVPRPRIPRRREAAV
ncbi:hypothetical protein GGF31_008206 [Allomyces arbusculus]|nr:hypothetical protein GGF31_008206 [Allomyces arbusculus]